MDYTLIIANRNYSSWSLRPWVLMRVLGIPFAERIELFAGTDNYERFRAFSPAGQVPALVHRGPWGERTVWDTLAIALYLAERHAGVWPEGEEARAWAQAIVAEMHSGFAPLRRDCRFNLGVRIATPPITPELRRDVARIREIFAEGPARFGGPWLAGAAFTAADAFYAPIIFRARTYGLDVGAGQAWVDHVIAHPAMREWEAAALAEPWRETDFEEELAAAGVVTADHRAG